MEINGRTGFFCLIGSPVGHSGSPAMYNYSFQKTEQDYVYLAFDVDLDKTEEAVSASESSSASSATFVLHGMSFPQVLQ